jgi:hypothetical protein
MRKYSAGLGINPYIQKNNAAFRICFLHFVQIGAIILQGMHRSHPDRTMVTMPLTGTFLSAFSLPASEVQANRIKVV